MNRILLTIALAASAQLVSADDNKSAQNTSQPATAIRAKLDQSSASDSSTSDESDVAERPPPKISDRASHAERISLDTLAAILAAFGALGCAVYAGMADKRSKDSLAAQINLFQRQGIIDLHLVWQGVNQIDPVNPITPDVIKAVGAMELTSALWNHDVVAKIVIYQSYWEVFKELYETILSSSATLPGMSRSLRSCITAPVSTAYLSMREHSLVRTTSLQGV